MKMEHCKTLLKCDFVGCKNMAKYAFSTKEFLRHEIVFCEDCMKKMFDCFCKECVPKSVAAPYKQKRRENERKSI